MHPLWLAAPLTLFRSDQWEASTPSRLSTCSPTAIVPSEKKQGDGDGSIATWHGRATDGSIGGGCSRKWRSDGGESTCPAPPSPRLRRLDGLLTCYRLPPRHRTCWMPPKIACKSQLQPLEVRFDAQTFGGSCRPSVKPSTNRCGLSNTMRRRVGHSLLGTFW